MKTIKLNKQNEFSRRGGLARLRSACDAVGATVEQDGGGRWVVYQCCAAPGMVWCETGGLHIRVEWPAGSSAADRSDCIRDAISRIASGCRTPTEREAFECEL